MLGKVYKKVTRRNKIKEKFLWKSLQKIFLIFFLISASVQVAKIDINILNAVQAAH